MKIDKYEVHPAAEVFPLMEGKEFDDLVEDIRKNGQQESIVFWREMLIDGRNRLRACLKLGIPFKDVEMPDDFDVCSYVVSANIHRRHLTDSQRAIIAAKLANLKAGRPSKEIPPNGGITTNQAAKQLKVPTRTVERAKEVIDKGSPDLVKAVEQGAVPISKAAKIAKTGPKEDQIKVATAPRPTPKPTPKPVDKPPSKPESVAEKPAKPAKAVTLADEQQSEDEQWVLQFVRSRSRAHKLRLLLDELTESEAHVVQAWYEKQVSIAD